MHLSCFFVSCCAVTFLFRLLSKKYLVINRLEMFKIFCAYLQIDKIVIIVIISIYFKLSYNVATKNVLHVAIITKSNVQNLKT